MSNLSEIMNRLLSTLKEIKREIQYQGLKQYVQNLKAKRYLNGKEKFYLRGAKAYIRRIEADRRSKSLSLIPFIPYDERQNKSEEIQGSYLSWDRSVCLFDAEQIAPY